MYIAGEIDSRTDSFNETVERGNEITGLSSEIADKLEELEREKQEVADLWDEKLIQYNQCMDLQLFFRYVVFVIGYDMLWQQLHACSNAKRRQLCV